MRVSPTPICQHPPSKVAPHQPPLWRKCARFAISRMPCRLYNVDHARSRWGAHLLHMWHRHIFFVMLQIFLSLQMEKLIYWSIAVCVRQHGFEILSPFTQARIDVDVIYYAIRCRFHSHSHVCRFWCLSNFHQLFVTFEIYVLYVSLFM